MLAGIVLAGGRAERRGGETVLVLRSESPAVARTALSLLREAGAVIRTLRRERAGHPRVEVEARGPAVPEWLATCGIPEGPGNLGPLLRSKAARRAFLRGLFLGSGSINDPHAGPHLELVLPTADAVRWSRRAAATFGLAIRAGRRKDGHRAYLKGATDIAEFLRVVGAGPSLLAFEGERARREVRNRVNRLVNADTANMRKAARAAARQIEAVQFLAGRLGWDGIPARLRDLARLRLEYPEASLGELGSLLRPPLGKSGVRYRMDRLIRLKEAISQRSKE